METAVQPQQMGRVGALAVALALVCLVLVGGFLISGFGGIGAQPAKQYTLRATDESGVTGTVTLTAVGDVRTSVQVDVDPAGNLNMPAHIHPGPCDNPIPQPAYPLQNVVDGQSTTEISATVDDLLINVLSVNLHKSNDELGIYMACVEFR